MPARSWFSWNFTYIKTYNSCNNVELQNFYNEILEYLPKGFTRKRYLWNILRGKTFYINVARYVITNLQASREKNCEDPKSYLDKASRMMRAILLTTKDERICRSFIRNIVKSVPLLTIETIQYLDSDRISMILANADGVFSDECLNPFINRITELMEENESLKQLIELQGGM